MNSSLEIIPFLLVVLLMAGVWLVYPYLKLRDRRRAWSELAQRTGLTLIPGNLFFKGPKLQGIYRGHDLILETFSQSSGRGSVSYTRISVSTQNPVGLQLSLYDESLASKLGKALGMKDIQLGDDAMNRRFIIKGAPESSVTRLLAGINLRQRLLETHSVNIQVDGSQVVYEHLWVELDGDYLLFLFDLLTALADGIDGLV